MDSYAYSSEDRKLKQIEPDTKMTPSPGQSVLRNRWLVWGTLSIIFLLLYTGGSYYVIFAGQELKENPPAVFPTPRKATATPIPTPTEVPPASPVPGETAGWKTYTNKTYDIRFQYPEELELTFNNTAANQDPYLMKLSYKNSSASGALTIDVQDIAFVGQSDQQSRTIMQMNLLDFATEKRSLNFTYSDPNVPARRVGSLITMTFSEKPAYSFTVTGSYYDDRGYQTLNEEYTYVFTENDSYKIIISYPSSDALFKKVVGTINFY